jgi:hypothetical protein
MNDDLRCAESRSLLTRRRSGLSEPDGLRLEEHLERCAECRFDAAVLDGFARLSGAEPAGFAERALSSALRAPQPARTAREVRRGRAWWIAAAAIGVAAAAALAISSREGWASPDPAGEPRAPEQRGHLVASRPIEIQVAHARVEVARGTELSWRGAEVTLARGRLHVEVDPRAHARFSVRTESFVVEVTGTSFDVTPDEVRVERGSVRVVGSDGAILDPRVGPGESWPRAQPRAEVPAPITIDPPAVARVSQEALPQPSSQRARRPRASQNGEAATNDARARWEAAVRAEVTDQNAALRAYEEIERGGGPYAGTALFARARLLGELGRRREARDALLRYLERYPGGPNADDARELLQR